MKACLSEKGDSRNDVRRRLEIGVFGNEQGEFTGQLVYIKRIQRAQELGKEDKSKAQALTMLEFNLKILILSK